MDFSSYWQMFTTTLGSAAVIAGVAMLFFSSRKRSELHKNNKAFHRVLVGLLFGVLSIYASVSAVEVESALCNCRNLAPLYAGMVGGPVAGILAGVIGGLFRWIAFDSEFSIWFPCALACVLSGLIGSGIHIAVKREWRYHLLTGLVASLLTEGVHMGLVCVFGHADLAAKLAGPIILANVAGLAFCLYIYKKMNASSNASSPSDAE